MSTAGSGCIDIKQTHRVNNWWTEMAPKRAVRVASRDARRIACRLQELDFGKVDANLLERNRRRSNP